MQLGSLVFPGKGFIQEHHLSISHDELKRITQKSDFLLLSVLAIVSYRFVFDGSINGSFSPEVRTAMEELGSKV